MKPENTPDDGTHVDNEPYPPNKEVYSNTIERDKSYKEKSCKIESKDITIILKSSDMKDNIEDISKETLRVYKEVKESY